MLVKGEISDKEAEKHVDRIEKEKSRPMKDDNERDTGRKSVHDRTRATQVSHAPQRKSCQEEESMEQRLIQKKTL